MQQYPNYWANNYQQYQQPVYPGQMMQSQQLPYVQQAPVQQAPPGLSARIVDDFNAITANDVPMDGNGALFIKKDGSEIQLRNWTSQGTIAKNVFKPIQIDEPKEMSTGDNKTEIRLSDDVLAVLREHYEKINKRFDVLEKAIGVTNE